MKIEDITIKDIKDKLLDLIKGERKVGLALGGGAARGVAHIGVLKVLISNNIPIHMIAGTSSGALVGALYAGGLNIDEMEAAAKRAGWSRLVRIAIGRRGAVSGESMERLVEDAIGYREFGTLKIPFSAIASDLRTGEKVVLQTGSVGRAVHASSAIPGVFVPVSIDGKLLADGMITDNVPVDVVKEMGADFIIAVDVIPKVVLEKDPENMVEVLERGLDIGVRLFSEPQKAMADIIIEPVTKNLGPFGLNYSSELIEMGVRAAEGALTDIKKKLGL